MREWADELLSKSPTALRVLKHSFNVDSESMGAVGALAFDALELFLTTDESHEGKQAFVEKRPVDYSPFR